MLPGTKAGTANCNRIDQNRNVCALTCEDFMYVHIVRLK